MDRSDDRGAVKAGRLIHSICVFCGSSQGLDRDYLSAAAALGREIAATHRRLVFGGSNVGLMSALAEAALAENGEAIGVIPEHLHRRGIAHPRLTALHVVPAMAERKRMMTELADAFVALPGGLGTLDELFDAWASAQLGLHEKPIGALNVNGFFDPLLVFVDRAVAERFISREGRAELIVESSPAVLLARLERRRASRVPHA